VYRYILKRALDIFLSFIGIILLSPVFILFTLILVIANKGNPFFVQRRPGAKQKEIFIIKFKSMNEKKDSNGVLLQDKDRITKVGNFIRKYSIDELPQLFNVIKGDMSLIGPRPLLFDYIPLYKGDQIRRHEVRPGITGWAQVNGRNSITWTKKFELDVWYVNNLSFMLDIKIIFLSVLKVFKKEGIEFEKPQEIRRFNGTN
jgi:undecaprenyl phosphate N,N'-diacetylbacillosamine 1-phosphate transferase